jgi:hypothetical protein
LIAHDFGQTQINTARQRLKIMRRDHVDILA